MTILEAMTPEVMAMIVGFALVGSIVELGKAKLSEQGRVKAHDKMRRQVQESTPVAPQAPAVPAPENDPTPVPDWERGSDSPASGSAEPIQPAEVETEVVEESEQVEEEGGEAYAANHPDLPGDRVIWPWRRHAASRSVTVRPGKADRRDSNGVRGVSPRHENLAIHQRAAKARQMDYGLPKTVREEPHGRKSLPVEVDVAD